VRGLNVASGETRERPSGGVGVRRPATGERPAYTVRSTVGGLLEIRAWRVARAEDMLALDTDLRIAAPGLPLRTIVFADYRHTRPFAQEVADVWSRCMRDFNGRLSVSGILLDAKNETFNLQLERVVRCAGNASRRTFQDARELRDWLARDATGTELARLDELLREEP
jgi:hypothetical protein